MVRYLKESEKQRCRSLWEEAFAEDSPAFVTYYFEEKNRDNRILVREEDGVIQSMLHLNPYRLAVKDVGWQADYIVGVATRADCRRRGYMRELLDEMFRDLWNREMPFVFLMPAAKEIYEPFDFVYIFDQPVWQLKEDLQLVRQELLPADTAAGSDSWAAVSEWMNRWLAKRYQVYAVRDRIYLERLAKELASEQGKMELLCEGHNTIGIYAEWGAKAPEQRLLYAGDAYVTKSGEKPAIMARIVNLNAFLSKICLNAFYISDEMQILLQLTDEWIPENHGLWYWTLTKETSRAEPAETEGVSAAQLGMKSGRDIVCGTSAAFGGQAVLELSIGELTSWLFGYSLPKAAEPYQDAVCTLQDVFLDEVV